MSRIILEGPDGGGKTTLLKVLTEAFPNVPVREKFVDSVNYTDPNTLFDRAFYDMMHTTSGMQFYDRHPFISELVYGPQLRGHLPTPVWSSTRMRDIVRKLANTSLVIWCQPSRERLTSSVTSAEQMNGVTSRIEHIAAAYDAVRALWPGARTLMYDFDHSCHLSHVKLGVGMYIAEHNRLEGI
jgi:predicted ATPase